VVAIIAILAALLLAGVWGAREKARRSACAGNMRQIFLALEMYTQDYSGYIPTWYDHEVEKYRPQPMLDLPAYNYEHDWAGSRTLGFILEPEHIRVHIGHMSKLIKGRYVPDVGVMGCPSANVWNPGTVRKAWITPLEVILPNGYITAVCSSAYVFRALAYGAPKQLGGKNRGTYAILMDQAFRDPYTGLVLANHGFEWVNVLFSDGHVKGMKNTPDVYIHYKDDVCYAVQSQMTYSIAPSAEAIWPHAEGFGWNPYLSNFDVYQGDDKNLAGYIPETWAPPEGWSPPERNPRYFRENWIIPRIESRAFLP